LASCPTSLDIDPLDVRWVTDQMRRHGCTWPQIVRIVATPQELYLGGFVYDPVLGQLTKLPANTVVKLCKNDDLRDYLNDWHSTVRGEYYNG